MGCCAKLGGTVFRRLFLESLQKAFDAGKLQFFGALDSLREARGFARCIARGKKTPNVLRAPSFRLFPGERVGYHALLRGSRTPSMFSSPSRIFSLRSTTLVQMQYHCFHT